MYDDKNIIYMGCEASS